MEVRYSRLGIASLTVTITGIAATIALFIFITVNSEQVNRGGSFADTMFILYGLFGVINAAIYLVAAGLGIAGVIQKKLKRDFAVASLCVLAGVLIIASAVAAVSI